MAFQKGHEVPTIDVALVTITVPNGKEGTGGIELALDTANKVAVEVQSDTQDAVKLVVKGKLIAQKKETVTITGHQITLTDNVFNAQLAQILQGGKITYDSVDTKKVLKYTPPVAGSDEKGKIFTLNLYSAIYDASGICTGYEKTLYPNCQGQPFANSSEDGTFRQSEYTITSSPNKGEAPYEIEYVDALPEVHEYGTVQ